MENPSKRQRVSRQTRWSCGSNVLSGVHIAPARSDSSGDRAHNVEEMEILESESIPSPSDLPSANLVNRQQFWRSRSLKYREADYRAVRRRDHEGHFIAEHKQGKTAFSTIVDVIIDEGSSAIAQITLPAIPTVPAIFSFANVGPVTIPAMTGVSAVPSFPHETTPAIPVVTLSSPMAVSTSTSSQVPSAGPSEGYSTFSSRSTQATGSSSQAILTSPPSTPLPSSLPSFSSTSSSPSSSPSPSSLAPSLSSPSTPVPSEISPLTLSLNASTTRASFSTLSSGHNSTLSSSTMQATTIHPSTTTLNFGTFTSNSTQFITSTAIQTTLPSFVSIPHLSSTISSTSRVSTSRGTTLTTSRLNTSTSTVISSRQSSTTASSSSEIGVVPGGAGGVGSATSTVEGSLPTSTLSNTPTSSNNKAIPTPVLAGGVVGGLAGLAIILVILLLFLRWRRKKMRNHLPAGPSSESGPLGAARSAGGMIERSSEVPIVAAAAGFFGRLRRPDSGQTVDTIDTAPSERGFQNLGGRKIESVLTSGGDGYGGPGPSDTMSGSSFYRDSQGTHGGPDSLPSSMYVGPGSPPTSSTPPIGATAGSAGRGSGISEDVAVMRPSPARTPVTAQGVFTPHTPRSTPPALRGTPPPGGSQFPRDGVGRSRPDLDSSRTSRFRESSI